MMTELKNDWKFIRQDVPRAWEKDFDDSAWRSVRIPHDYAIEGPFDRENDKQMHSVEADGIMHPIELIGRTGGLPVAEPAWYRRRFAVSGQAKHVFLEFDGIMSNSEVYVNGRFCGGRHYGYSSFQLDVTDAVHSGEDNLLAVSVHPEASSSRWYPGAGIYRAVGLVEKNESYFPYQCTKVSAEVRSSGALVDVSTRVCCRDEAYELEYAIYDEDRREVLRERHSFAAPRAYAVFTLEEYRRWHVLDPHLYTLEITLYADGKQQDTYSTRFGIRTIEFDAERGFFLNGRRVRFNAMSST